MPGNILGCFLVSLCFLCDIHSIHPVHYISYSNAVVIFAEELTDVDDESDEEEQQLESRALHTDLKRRNQERYRITWSVITTANLLSLRIRDKTSLLQKARSRLASDRSLKVCYDRTLANLKGAYGN